MGLIYARQVQEGFPVVVFSDHHFGPLKASNGKHSLCIIEDYVTKYVCFWNLREFHLLTLSRAFNGIKYDVSAET